MKKKRVLFALCCVLIFALALVFFRIASDGQTYLRDLIDREPVSVKLSGWGEKIVLEDDDLRDFLQIMNDVTVSPSSRLAMRKEGAVPASATFYYADGTSVKIGLPLFQTNYGVYCCRIHLAPLQDYKPFQQLFE